MRARSKTAVMIDCDPGLDDAIALALAACAPEIEIEAITTVAGNAEIARVTDNALSIAAALSLKCPVYAGAAAPLRVKPHYSTMIWGGDGSLGLKRPRRGALTEPANDFLTHRLEQAEDGSLLLCMLAPLTNLGAILLKKPELARKISRLMIMGGALGAGNATRSAELNMWFDPHAAQRVLASGIPAVIVPLDLTRTIIPTRQHLKRLERSEHPAAQLCARLLLAGAEGQPDAIHDACVIGCLLWPDLFSFERGTMTINMGPGPARGQTRFAQGEGPHTLITGVELTPFLDKLIWRLTAKGTRAK
ncbi:MAG: nucleoside hydrolase [Aestuariivirgaceae bacterium]|nr:nucleoside hydrolase [Aestuariivirgaceae bacterium]